MRRTSEDDVIKCYKTFLSREPENADIVDFHVANTPDVWVLIQAFKNSREANIAAFSSILRSLGEKPYLFNALTVGDRYRCFFHNSNFITSFMRQRDLLTILEDRLVVLATEQGGRFTLRLSTPSPDEGDLTLEYFHFPQDAASYEGVLPHLAESAIVYVLAFSIIPGSVIGRGEDDVIAITRMQGVRKNLELSKHATKAHGDISPQAVLFAVLQGVARWLGISSVIGFPATQQVRFSEENSQHLTRSYDGFYDTCFRRTDDLVYEHDLDADDVSQRPLSKGHRSRHRVRRQRRASFARLTFDHLNERHPPSEASDELAVKYG